MINGLITMKKAVLSLFIVACFLGFVPIITHAGSWNGWIYQDPYPTSNTLQTAKFVTSKKGWIAGENGTILYTEDGGDSWEYQESGTEQTIKSISFINGRKGWAVGGSGIIIHTENGGKTWVSQAGTKSFLQQVFFLNHKQGWAVGAEGNQGVKRGGIKGVLFHTKDGGKKWERIETGIKRIITSVCFVNSNVGWILAADEVYRTKDGGKKWERSKLPVKLPGFGPPGMKMAQKIPRSWDRGATFFVDEETGWAVVGYGFIFHTKNGGKTWKNQFKTGALSYGLNQISFIDAKRGCAVGSSIVCTEDGGKTWKEKLKVAPGSGKRIDHFMIDFWGVSIVNQSIGWAVGNDGLIMKTENGGRTWKMAARRDECGGDVFFITKNNGWFYRTPEYATYICRTDDGGHTRRKQEVGIRVWDLFFSDPSTGWAAGTIEVENKQGELEKVYGVIRHTADGGKTWSTQFKELMDKSRFDAGLFGIFFINPDSGWVVGEKGFILHTTDGGKHWDQQRSGSIHYHLRGVHFLDAKIGWIIGTKLIEGESGWTGIILHTEDSGKQWHVQHKKGDAWLADICFTDNETGWVTGNPEYSEYSYLLHTEDRGKTWAETGFTNIGTSYLAFLDKNRGVISGNKGWIVITTDRGKTWVKKRKPLRKNPWHFSEVFTGAQGAKQLVDK